MTEAAATVKSFFEALGSKDKEKALQLVDEDAIFIAMRKESSDQVPLYGTFKKKEGFKKFWKLWQPLLTRNNFKLIILLEKENGLPLGVVFNILLEKRGDYLKASGLLFAESKTVESLVISFMRIQRLWKGLLMSNNPQFSKEKDVLFIRFLDRDLSPL